MTTYHGKNGKFCPPESARVVTKGGEQFKVVRQHRRIGPKGGVSLDLKRAVEARERVRSIGEMRGWVPLCDVLR